MRALGGIVLVWLLFVGHPCGAQQKVAISARAMEELVDPHPIEQSSMHFETTELEIPALCEDDEPTTVTFRFTNEGKVPLVITRVAVSCGCIAADYDKAPILPRKGGAIRVTFSPSGHPGKLLRKIFVHTSLSKQAPTARLTLIGEVAPSKDPWCGYPHALGELRTRQREVTIRSNGRRNVVECIACVNTGKQPLCLGVSDQNAPYLHLSTTPATLRPAEEGDLVVTLDAARMPSDLADSVRIPLMVDGCTAPPAERTLFITIINR